MPAAFFLSTAAVIVGERTAATACARPAYFSSAAAESMDTCPVRSGVLSGCIAVAILTLHVAGRGWSGRVPVSVAAGPASGIDPCLVISEEEQQWWLGRIGNRGWCSAIFIW